MTIENIYIAEDGTRFTSKDACLHYEEQQRTDKYEELEDYVIFYDRTGNRLDYSRVAINEFCAYFANVIKLPVWGGDDYEIWSRVVPTELDAHCCSFGLGWYISDGDGEWHNWEDFSSEFTWRNRTINEIICEKR